jgi:carboxynorspermidine decarboxylase
MDLNSVKNNLQSSPAYVFDEELLIKNLTTLNKLKKQSGCKILYSIKALPLGLVLKLAKNYLDGLSVSSLFEARLAKEILADTGTIHITTPGLRANEFKELTELCSHISFNSLTQYQQLQSNDPCSSSWGLRLNPQLSFSSDPRFDPCRVDSKLGIAITALQSIPEKIEGLHFHTVFSKSSYLPLEKTVGLLKNKYGDKLHQMKWLNLGGGYLYDQIECHKPFVDLVSQLITDYDIDVYIEPGKAVVGNAGYLVTTVIDCFNNDGKNIAVLDTSVNHNPEVFEYQRRPELFESEQGGDHTCLLVGSSCLAGDVFAEYQFEAMPKVGDRLVFSNVGAYSLIKANRFNGYNLPDIYSVDAEATITLVKQNTYQNYRDQWLG